LWNRDREVGGWQIWEKTPISLKITVEMVGAGLLAIEDVGYSVCTCFELFIYGHAPVKHSRKAQKD
jgi:hypothetical protein